MVTHFSSSMVTHFSSSMSSQTSSSTVVGTSPHSWVLMVVQACTSAVLHSWLFTAVHLVSSSSRQVDSITLTQTSLGVRLHCSTGTFSHTVSFTVLQGAGVGWAYVYTGAACTTG